jgi:outer membrane protein assembly factor BamB
MAIALRQTAAAHIARGPIVLMGPFLSETSIFTGQLTDFAVKLDKRSLKEVWRKKQTSSMRSVHGDNILIFFGKKKEMQLWNGDGKVVWTRPGNEWARGDRLYFSHDSTLHVVDVMTGRTVDEFPCPIGTPRFERDGILLLVEEGPTGRTYAIDLTARTVLWEVELRANILERFGDPCPAGFALISSRPGSVVVKTRAHLVSVSLADGSMQWGLPLSVPHIAPMARGGRLYVWSAPDEWTTTRVTIDAASGAAVREQIGPDAADNRLVIVDEATGGVVADRALSEYEPAFGRPQNVYGGALCQNHVLFTSSSGLMALFRLSDGEFVWQHEYGEQLFSPVFADNRLYIPTAGGDIVVFDAHGDAL